MVRFLFEAFVYYLFFCRWSKWYGIMMHSEFQCFIFYSAVTWLALGSIPAWIAIYFFIFNLFDQLLWIITKYGLSATLKAILIKSFANQIYFILESLLNLFRVLMCVEVNGYQFGITSCHCVPTTQSVIEWLFEQWWMKVCSYIVCCVIRRLIVFCWSEQAVSITNTQSHITPPHTWHIWL